MFSFRFFLLCFIIIHGLTAARNLKGKKGSKGSSSSASSSSGSHSHEEKNKVCFYTKPNYQGSHKCFSLGQGDLCEAENGGCFGSLNDKIFSVRLGKKVKRVELFLHENFDHPLGKIYESTKELSSKYHGFTSFNVEN